MNDIPLVVAVPLATGAKTTPAHEPVSKYEYCCLNFLAGVCHPSLQRFGDCSLQFISAVKKIGPVRRVVLSPYWRQHNLEATSLASIRKQNSGDTKIHPKRQPNSGQHPIPKPKASVGPTQQVPGAPYRRLTVMSQCLALLPVKPCWWGLSQNTSGSLQHSFRV